MPFTPSPAVRNAWITVSAPGDGRVLGTLPMHTPERVRTLVTGLRAAQIDWRGMGVVGRTRWVTQFRDWLAANRQRLVDLFAAETGKSVAAAMREFRLCLDALDYHRTHGAEFLHGQRLRPHALPTVSSHLAIAYRSCPVVGVVAPWAHPLAVTVFDAIPALLTGSAVLVKPSSLTPLTVRALVGGWAELGAPPVLDFVVGRDAGPALVDTVDYVHFTGSPETGKMVALRTAARLVPCRLELGGKSAALVLADADLDRAAAGIALGGLSDCGQNCHSIERIFVESACYEAFVERLTAEVAGWTPEPGEYSEVMTSSAHVRRVHEQVRDARAKGASLRIGGSGRDHVFEPTVLADVEPTMSVLTQQTLGPVLPVMRVESAEAALALINDPCGPAASIWTSDDSTGRESAGRIVAARVAVADVSVHLMPAHL
ncbi:aldehyde dehydrogenase family protein [Nocardia aurantia]|uniref:Putative succinate-semialdehyde dehydrogenase [NADP(+)] 2 n=1 Tax=Nocardia aurantia TaxID=2585199 RepID=A0A7K0DUI2_9NOCA|nr:aldehyde dehydrogenase family protein [Nocardia aurantia]MQY29423.1 putative succinate-semialdehyde dehydrogenase [NADP(+)] 2 [Nocardia aurantia]